MKQRQRKNRERGLERYSGGVTWRADASEQTYHSLGSLIEKVPTAVKTLVVVVSL